PSAHDWVLAGQLHRTRSPILNWPAAVGAMVESQTHDRVSATLWSTPSLFVWVTSAHGLKAFTDRYGYPAAVLKIWATSPGRLSPNGHETAIAVTKPATPVVITRMGPRTLRSQAVVVARGSGASSAPYAPSGQNARRITTIATSGMRIPSCGL